MITQTSSLSSPATDPLRNFKFQLIFRPATGPSVTMGFMTLSGLGLTIDNIPYREGGYNCLSLDTPVLTTSGWKEMGDIEVGDQVIDPLGQPSKVTGVYPKGIRPVFRVTLQDGRYVHADAEHLWQVESIAHGTEMTVNTAELKELIEGRKVRVKSAGRTRTRGAEKGIRLIGMVPAQFESIAELPVDPYLLGVLLSEGANPETNGVRFEQNGNPEMLARIAARLPAGHSLVTYATGTTHAVTTPRGYRNQVLDGLREIGLGESHAWTKFIPEIYKFASVEDRLALLQGIMDGDGSMLFRHDAGKPEGTRVKTQFRSSSERLRDDVAGLIRSLGGQCTTGIQQDVWYTSPSQAEPKAARDAYTIPSVQMPEGMNPCFIAVKAANFKPGVGAYQRKVVSVVPAGEADVQCISVSADSKCYVIKDFITTHNTTVQNLPGQATFSPLTVQKGLMVGKQFQIPWVAQLFTVMQGTGSQTAGKDFRSTIDVLIIDHPVTAKQAPVKAAFTIYRAWPTSLQYSDLDAGADQLLITQMTLVHEGFTPSVAAAVGNSEASY